MLGQVVGAVASAPGFAAAAKRAADRVCGPLLLVAATEDERCPFRQVRRYVDLLAVRGVPHRMVWREGAHSGGHAAEQASIVGLAVGFLRAVWAAATEFPDASASGTASTLWEGGDWSCCRWCFVADATGTARAAGAASVEGGAAPTERAAAPARSRTAVRFLPKLSMAPLKVRTFRLLVIGQGVSEFGNAFGLVALPLLIFARGGSAAQIGLVASGFGVGRILTTSLSGLLIDRLGAWRVMMASDLGRMALAGGLTVVAATGRGSVLLIGVWRPRSACSQGCSRLRKCR